MNRIEGKLKDLSEKKKKAFVGYITAGDPTLDKTEQLVYTLEEAGTDIVEIGIPYSDPLADGPTIQEAGLRAFKNSDLSVKNIMKVIRKIRKNTNVPLAFLVYINTIIVYGKERFIRECEEIGIDGLIIPDLPFEERHEIIDLINETEIALIPLVAPTSRNRISKVVEGCKGFTYCVSSLGVTGRNSDFYSDITTYLLDVKEKSHLPIVVGFGISTPSDIAFLAPYVDGVIVGSAIVNKVNEGNGDPVIVKEFVKTLTNELEKY